MKLILATALALTSLTVAAQQITEQIRFRPDGLQTMTVQVPNCTGFWKTPSFKCPMLDVPAYLARSATGDHRALVIISHGSQGLDRRHSDYAQHLAASGINALVLGHWEARGLGKVQLDYNAGRDKGGTGFNMAIDVLAASSQLKQLPEWKDTRLGYIGESMGGSAAINVTRPYIESIVAEAMQRPVHNIDAVVALYPGCIDRVDIERFKPVPMLFVSGDRDNITPASSCEVQRDWMNGRGGQVEMMILKGEHHDFDAPFAIHSVGYVENVSKCGNVRKGDKFVLESNGQQFPGTPDGLKELRRVCTIRGGTSGNSGDPKTGYDVWTTFFKKKLLN